MKLPASHTSKNAGLMNLIKKLWRAARRRSHAAEESKPFIDVLEEYVQKYVRENQLNDRTADHYEQRYRNIHRFLIDTGNQSIRINELRIKHMEELRAWLLTKGLKTCGRRHASLHVDLCKRAVKYAISMEYCSEDWISPIKGQRDKAKPVIYLSMAEVRQVMCHKFRSPMFDVVAKMFCLQCFTGLSYGELFTFKTTEIKGRKWIDSSVGRNKTGSGEYVYIFDEGLEILEYFGGKVHQIPNQTCNRILKEIAGLLNIDKHLTTHIGRKTHASLLDERGASMGTIARQLRNTIRICEERYTAKSHLRTQNEFDKLSITGRLLTS